MERRGFAEVWLLALFPAIFLSSCGQDPTSAATSKAPAPPEPVRITMFYSSTPSLPRGDSSLLCYGVENAAVVRLEPPVEKLKPAFNHCFTVWPAGTTTYTLTAEDQQGKTVSQKVTINIGPPLPKFVDLSINSKQVAPGQPVTFCFKAKNAVSVKAGPGRFAGRGAATGDCLIDHPRRTTTYTITITGAGGQTEKADMTVEVRNTQVTVTP